MLSRMFDRRCRGYEALGYTHSAARQRVAGVAGGGAAAGGSGMEKGLRRQRPPAHPRWRGCSAGGLCLCHAARSPEANAEGEARARSASEAFLFRRLETLPETAGRFRLNVELPIAFDDCGKMEVDFLCAEAGVVIELDGPQHFAGAEAYRRDRRKDVLLQQHGYFVLRFLVEDVGRQLDLVLDTVLTALAHRKYRGRG